MIYIYTEIKTADNWIMQNDLYFNLYTANQTFTENDCKAISEIDNARITADNHIETKYGLGTIRNLSSGCKTYLNIIKNPDCVVNIDECGANVLEKLFALDGIKVYMSKPERFRIEETKEICFNEEEIVIGKAGYDKWWSEEYERRMQDDL